MTMLSFRVTDADAAETRRWAAALGVDRSELLRRALHRHLADLRGAGDAAVWQELPLSDEELGIGAIADWGPAEEWEDWADATG